MATGIALCYYEKAGVGVTGLTVTTTVYQVALANLATVTLVNAQTMTEIGGGLYAYRLASLDFSLYWYPFTCTTAGDVDTATLAGLVHDFTQVELTAYGASITGDAMTLTAAYDLAKTAAQAGDAMALTGAERISTAGVFLATILEGAHTVADGLRIMLAALAGKSTGGGTFTNRFRDVADSKNRVVATVDSDGNRAAITTLDGT